MARARRHSAALYDVIWDAALPDVRDVADHVVRLTLLALAKHTNPSRDNGVYRCWMTVETIAQLVNVSERQVQRVLSTLYLAEWLTVERWGQRAGRNRPSQPCVWRLLPETWPRREMGVMVTTVATHGGDGAVATNGMVATVASMVATPPSPEHVIGTRNNDELVKEPARAREEIQMTNHQTSSYPESVTCLGCGVVIDTRNCRTAHPDSCQFFRHTPAQLVVRHAAGSIEAAEEVA